MWVKEVGASGDSSNSSASNETVEDTGENIDLQAGEAGRYTIASYANIPGKGEFARGWFGLDRSGDLGFLARRYIVWQQVRDYMPAYTVLWYMFHYTRGLPPSESVGDEPLSIEKFRGGAVTEAKGEVVTVSAGTFRDCLKLRAIAPDSDMRGQYPQDSPVDLQRYSPEGTIYMWLAPGVGLLRLECHHSDDTIISVELTSYSVSEKSKGYLPLDIGNSWTYEWTDAYQSGKLNETYTVISDNPDTAMVCWYLLEGVKVSGSKEMEDGWNLSSTVKKIYRLSDEEFDAAVKPMLDLKVVGWRNGKLRGFPTLPSVAVGIYGIYREASIGKELVRSGEIIHKTLKGEGRDDES
jgi:hypothetical protein